METRDTNDLVTAKGVSPIAGKRDSCSDENTDRHTPPPRTHTHREKEKQCKRRLQQHRTDRGGSVWHVASQEVNHDWLTMMVPGSVAGHWLA